MLIGGEDLLAPARFPTSLQRAASSSPSCSRRRDGVGVLIPYLVGRTVDEIRDNSTNLWPLALAVAGAGVLRLAFSVARRIVAGRVSLGVEYDLRNRMYGHLQSLRKLAFFDGQQTGQLMSRATVDLQSDPSSSATGSSSCSSPRSRS